jgi:hypothetical protein
MSGYGMCLVEFIINRTMFICDNIQVYCQSIFITLGLNGILSNKAMIMD